jgi:hypothetical protein
LAEGGKQIILQKQGGIGTPGQPQIVTLVKTSQGMQVQNSLSSLSLTWQNKLARYSSG